jgi:hypothetical protein
VYITRFVGECLRGLESVPNAGAGRQVLAQLALTPPALPGERAFPLNGLLETANSRAEADLLRDWLRQCRSECCLRVLGLYYTPKGAVSPLWKAVAQRSRKFFCVFGTYSQPVEEEAPYRRNTSSSRSIEVDLTEQGKQEEKMRMEAAADAAALAM